MSELEMLKKIEYAYSDSVKFKKNRDIEKALKASHVGIHYIKKISSYIVAKGDPLLVDHVSKMYDAFKANIVVLPPFLPIQTQPVSASSKSWHSYNGRNRNYDRSTKFETDNERKKISETDNSYDEWSSDGERTKDLKSVGRTSWNVPDSTKHSVTKIPEAQYGNIASERTGNVRTIPFNFSRADNFKKLKETNMFSKSCLTIGQSPKDSDAPVSILSPIPNRSSCTSARTGEIPAQTPVVAICANTKAAREISRDIGKPPDGSGLLSDDAISKMKVEPDLDNTMSTIVGLNSAKEALMETILLPIAAGDKYEKQMEYNGVLLFGATGVGKTSAVKAAISECTTHLNKNITFYNVSLSELLGTFHGVTEKNLTKLFAAAAACKPSVILLDEIDSITTKRSSEEKEGNRRIKNHLLSLMDGLGSSKGITIIGTTNRAHDMDLGFIRRFDRRIYVKLPDAKHRALILKNLIKSLQEDDADLDYEQLAYETYNFSPADLKSLVKAAYHNANWKDPIKAFISKIGEGSAGLAEFGATSYTKITQADLLRARKLTAATNDFDEIGIIEDFARKFATDTDNDWAFESTEPCSISWVSSKYVWHIIRLFKTTS
ncbi:unnamed protein product [Orchesella dallaii]|uniref:AAA+ ATPase domain-containing protein n=1 Tax=Orchesella dallaii TaxID=48710 RepID=A0ABP1RKB1_9HEXA